jgi:hypothetical protein
VPGLAAFCRFPEAYVAADLSIVENETIAALLRCRSRTEAAAALGIQPRALRERIAQHPAITEALREHRRDVVRSLADDLADIAAEGLKKIREVIEDAAATNTEKLQAAKLANELLAKYHDLDDLRDEMEQIKQLLKEKGIEL